MGDSVRSSDYSRSNAAISLIRRLPSEASRSTRLPSGKRALILYYVRPPTESRKVPPEPVLPP
jgi:hypothetical protein